MDDEGNMQRPLVITKKYIKLFDYQLLEQLYFNNTVLLSKASRLQILLSKMGNGQSHFKQIIICKNKCAYNKFCLLVFLSTVIWLKEQTLQSCREMSYSDITGKVILFWDPADFFIKIIVKQPLSHKVIV